MMLRSLGLILLGLAGCGGRVLEEPGPESGGASAMPSAPTSSGAAGSAGRGSASKPLPSHALRPCLPGFDRSQNPGRACNWADAEGKCFVELDDACACICPRDKDSVCWSDFPAPDQAVPVYCE